MSVIGVHIQATHTTTPVPYFTPWRGRRGNAAVFVADIIALNLTAGGSKVVIGVQTKNSEDLDPVGVVGSFANITGTTPPAAPPTKFLEDFLELYRFRIDVYGDPADDWVHMRMLDASWLTN